SWTTAATRPPSTSARAHRPRRRRSTRRPTPRPRRSASPPAAPQRRPPAPTTSPARAPARPTTRSATTERQTAPLGGQSPEWRLHVTLGGGLGGRVDAGELAALGLGLLGRLVGPVAVLVVVGTGLVLGPTRVERPQDAEDEVEAHDPDGE